MGQDGNTIEIEIDAAATVAAAKTAGEANAKLAKFNSALGLFRDNVDLVTKTTDIVASKIGDFDSLLQKFADNLTSNLADMQTSVVKKVEPHLERELENMVNRVLNKVEGKVAPEKESRSRSEAKQGAAAPAQPVTVAQPPEYKRPDTKVKATFTDTTNQIVDTATGQVKENTSNRARTTATKTRHWQEEIDGEIQDFTETITSVSNSVRKATTAEKDRGLAIRKEITGALIGLHVMKVVSQYSSVFNAGFMQFASAMGHLLNVVLLPMMPMFTIVAQLIHTLANFISMLPMPIRQLLGMFVVWKGISMIVASMPLKEIKNGFAEIRDMMSGASTGLQKFGRAVAAFIDWLNSGQGKGALSWVAGGIGKVAGKAKGLLGRASGGPVLGHGAYVVGEKGPEIFVPKTSGSIIPNHKAFRAEGGDVEGGGWDIMGSLGSLGAGAGVGTLAYLLTGSPLLAAGAAAGTVIGPEKIAAGLGAAVASPTGSDLIASMNVMTGMLSSILAPLAPIMGIVGALAGVVTGARAAGGGGGDGGRTAETVAAVGNAQIKATSGMNFGVQNAIGGTGRGTNKVLSMILMRLGGCLNVAPCGPDSFGNTAITTAITALPIAIATALSLALGTLIAPVLTNLAANITYKVAVIGSVPVAENIERTITWTRQVVGAIPEAISKTATITYDIIKRGTEPVISSATAYIDYIIRTTGTLPKIENLVAYIEAKFGPLAPTEWAKLKALIEEKAKADPPKLVVTADGKVEVEGELKKLEDRVPPEEKVVKDVKAKVAQLIDGIADPADKTIDNARAKVRDVAFPEGTKFDIPAGLSESDIMESLETAKKNLAAERVNLNAELTTPTGARERIQAQVDMWESLVAKLEGEITKVNPAKGALDGFLIDAQANVIGIRDAMIGDTYVDVVGRAWRVVAKEGNTLTIDLDGTIRKITLPKATVDGWNAGREVIGIEGEYKIDYEKIRAENRAIEARLSAGREGIAVPVKPEIPAGFDPKSILSNINWKSAGTVAGETMGFGILLAIQELGKTGTVDVPKMVAGLGIGTVGALVGTKIVQGIAGYLGGAAAATAVGAAFALLWEGIFAYEAANAMKQFVGDLQKGFSSQVVDASGVTVSFGNKVLEWAALAGNDFGKALNGWLEQNLNVTIPTEAFRLAGLALGTSTEMAISPTAEWPRIFGDFITNVKTTLAGGVPVDVKIDVDSVTSVVEAVRQTAGGTPISGGASVPGEMVGECPSGQYWDRALQACVPISGSVIPSHADGGRVIPNIPNLVGEKGPELFVPDSSPTSVSGGGGGGANVTNHFTFNVTTNNPKELTDAVMRELKLELARVKM